MKEVIGYKDNEVAIDSLMQKIMPLDDPNGTFYIGYPVLANISQNFTASATLVSSKFGFILFDTPWHDEAAKIGDEGLKKRRDRLYSAISSKLLDNPELQKSRRQAVEINVITYFKKLPPNISLGEEVCTENDILARLDDMVSFDDRYLIHLNATIERVSSMKPNERRRNAITSDSKGSKLRTIESAIANLDADQKRAAIETPDGPQRIRGLAGSGKTIVLALKAAYIHFQRPEWTIAVTFHTQSLYGQFTSLIEKFYFEDAKEAPDFDYLKIMHSFGGSYKSGIYSEICKAYEVPVRDFGYAKRTYGYTKAFQGVCQELLPIVERNPKKLFDLVIIDEAQDLPKEFLRLVYHTTRNHRVVWAYDDLQNLSDYQLGSITELFGTNEFGAPKVTLGNQNQKPRTDIILPKCYRNTPWTLATAHALGIGVYKEKAENEVINLIQHPDDSRLWEDIGYEVENGALTPGKIVTLRRSQESVPDFFNHLLNAEDAVQLFHYHDDREQLASVADMIHSNITVDELHPHDIMVIFPDAISASKRGLILSQYLRDRGIASHVVGTQYSRDIFKVRKSVALTGPYRAKGNESPMAYVLDSQYCASGYNLHKKRNILFTAITRSKAWVRICGFGAGMLPITNEYQRIVAADYKLTFTVPTDEQLTLIRTQHRDITREEEVTLQSISTKVKALKQSGMSTEAIMAMLQQELDT